MVFWNSAGFSLVFCQCKTLALLSPVLFRFLVTWDVTFCGITHGGRPAMYCALRTVKGREKSRMRTTYQKTVWDSGFFAHALFLTKKLKVMGFSGSVNGTTKIPGFLDFGFCQCKWTYCDLDNLLPWQNFWLRLLHGEIHCHSLAIFLSLSWTTCHQSQTEGNQEIGKLSLICKMGH